MFTSNTWSSSFWNMYCFPNFENLSKSQKKPNYIFKIFKNEWKHVLVSQTPKLSKYTACISAKNVPKNMFEKVLKTLAFFRKVVPKWLLYFPKKIVSYFSNKNKDCEFRYFCKYVVTVSYIFQKAITCHFFKITCFTHIIVHIYAKQDFFWSLVYFFQRQSDVIKVCKFILRILKTFYFVTVF